MFVRVRVGMFLFVCVFTYTPRGLVGVDYSNEVLLLESEIVLRLLELALKRVDRSNREIVLRR